MLTAPSTPEFSDPHAPDGGNAPEIKPDPNVSAPLDYTYVQTPDGQIHAVLTSDIKHVAQVPTAVSDAPKVDMVPKVEAQFYVWLANGDVKRVKESDLPTPAGTNAPYGHWQIGTSVFLIVGVYPVEDTH